MIEIKIMDNSVEFAISALTALGIPSFDVSDLLAMAINEDDKKLILVMKGKSIPIDLTAETKRLYKIISPYLHAKAAKAVE